METAEQQRPERMKRAIHAGCNEAEGHPGCKYPDCGCKLIPAIVRAAVVAWDALPVDDEVGLGWKISEQTRREIEEIEANIIR